MKNQLTILLLTILTTIIYSCNEPRQKTIQIKETTKNSDDLTTSSSLGIYNELVGGYGIENQKLIELNIIKEGGSFYLQFSKSSPKGAMTVVSDLDYARILGNNWRNILVSGLHSGAFFVIKVKVGSKVQGKTINSGFFGAIPAPVQLWKLK